MNEKEKGLYRSSVIYFVGSVLSKVLNILILPYISICLSPIEYGIYDLVQTVAALIVPVFTFQLIEVAYRFVFEACNKDVENVITNVVVAVCALSLVFVPIFTFLGGFFYSLEYSIYIVIYYIGTVIMTLYQRIARSTGCSKDYAISGVVQTIALLLIQLLFLKLTPLKIAGLIAAYFISAIISAMYLELRIHILKRINLKLIKFTLIKSYVKFSLPLVPNSVLWWGTVSLNRIVITTFLGYEANGIFAMSGKFASIITMVSSVIVMAWQELCIREEKNTDCGELYNRTAETYTCIIFYACICVTLAQKFYIIRFIDPAYSASLTYVPIVMLGVAFSSMSSFWGAGYLAYQKTMDSFKTTLVGAFLNVVLCLIGVKTFGLMGVAMGTTIGYAAIWVIRIYTMKSYFCIKIHRKYLVQIAVLLIAAAIVYYMLNEYVAFIASVIVFGIYLLVDGKRTLKLIGGSIR